MGFSAKLVIQESEKKKMLDTGAGFFLDEEDLIEEKRKEANIVQEPCKLFKTLINLFNILLFSRKKYLNIKAVPLPTELISCIRCQSRFAHSFLSLKFDLNICDSCRL